MKDAATILAECIAGQPLAAVNYVELDWVFIFGNDVCRLASDYWRILADGRIAFASSDHKQKFGHSANLDGEKVAIRYLANKIVEGVSIRSDTGDLTIAFEGGIALEALNLSSGYEGWQATGRAGSVIAQGGGNLVTYERN